MKDLRISDLKKMLDPAIILLKKSGFNNNDISYLMLETLYNYPPTEKVATKSSELTSENSEYFPNDVKCKILEIEDFLTKRRNNNGR